jgi:hypothetical protein
LTQEEVTRKRDWKQILLLIHKPAKSNTI